MNQYFYSDFTEVYRILTIIPANNSYVDGPKRFLEKYMPHRTSAFSNTISAGNSPHSGKLSFLSDRLIFVLKSVFV